MDGELVGLLCFDSPIGLCRVHVQTDACISSPWQSQQHKPAKALQLETGDSMWKTLVVALDA